MRTTYKTLTALMLGLGIYSTAFAETNSVDMTPEACLQDLEYSAALILQNDAGVIAKKWTQYPKHIQKIYDQQKAKIAEVKTAIDCKKAIQPFLTTIRKGHLGIGLHENAKLKEQSSSNKSVTSESATVNKIERVTTQKLSDSTTLLTVLSFDYALYEKIQQVITSNQDNLLHAPYLIIDLRSNDGGSDQTAQVLYKILGEAEYWHSYPQLYSSTANIAGWEGYKEMITDADSQKYLTKVIQKMRAQPNQWIQMSSSLESKEVITAKEVLATPKKVVILIDKNCGSSCEQFVLTAQQNSRVITMGRPTYGALDASNLMEQLTPSKLLTIYYASTYIHRPAGKEIDDIGITPAIKLPRPNHDAEYNAEIQLAQRYLEQSKI